VPGVERLRPHPRDPVDRILEVTRHRRVVLGRGNDEAVAHFQPAVEFASPRREAVSDLDVMIVGWRVEVLHPCEVDPRTEALANRAGEGDQPAVE
jgi:hypothetical protein